MPASARATDGHGRGDVFVPRSVEIVFDHVAELRHMLRWWPEHRSYRRLWGDGGRGTLYGWTTDSFGRIPLVGLTLVAEHERPARFAYRLVSRLGTNRMTYRFTPVESGTHVELETRRVYTAHEGIYCEEVARSLDRLAAMLAPAAD